MHLDESFYIMEVDLEAIPVVNYLSFSLTFRIEAVSHIQMISWFFLEEKISPFS